MTTQTIQLGDTDLTSYVHRLPDATDERARKVDALIDSVGGAVGTNALDVERSPLQMLLAERNEYPQIDLSFLSMHSVVPSRAINFHLPKFSVYKSHENGFHQRFTIDYFHKPHNFYYYINFDSSGHEHGPQLGELIGKNIVKSSNYYKFSKNYMLRREDGRTYIFDNLTGFNPFYFSAVFTTEFNGIIPKTTKQNLREARKIFGEEVYLIAETKPEEWNASVVYTDPLLIGVAKDRAFLVDHFDTTTLENYVVDEFT